MYSSVSEAVRGTGCLAGGAPDCFQSPGTLQPPRWCRASKSSLVTREGIVPPRSCKDRSWWPLGLFYLPDGPPTWAESSPKGDVTPPTPQRASLALQRQVATPASCEPARASFAVLRRGEGPGECNNFLLAFALSDKTLASWEEQLVGLESLSLADAFLSGVGKMLCSPQSLGLHPL